MTAVNGSLARSRHTEGQADKTMTKLIVTTLLIFGFCLSADADVWRWKDPDGHTHFVDTNRPIFTWRDRVGKVHFSDKPEHADAVSVELIWHSSGGLANTHQEADSREEAGAAYPGETEEEKAERENAEAYYCKRATDLYESYINSQRLYNIDTDGERVYLSDEEAAKAIAKTKAKVNKLCR